MCPPVQPPHEMDLKWSDEQITLLLAEYKPGSHLPDNVLADTSPYHYPPSNLPEGIWFLVHSNEKKESAYGFWKAKEEARKVYSNATIIGWKTTLEYFEGVAPHGQITDWLMQEYKITQKDQSDKDKPKESRLLCRVFLCRGHSLKSEMNPQDCRTVIESNNINPMVSIDLNINITSDQDSRSESKANRERELSPLFPVTPDMNRNTSPQLFCDEGLFLGGDFLELDDLKDLESHSSSSLNSSCPSTLSDEYFDSSAFLRDLEKEGKGQRFSSSYSFSTPDMPNSVVVQPALSGSTGRVITRVTEAPRTSSTNDDGFSDRRAQEHATKGHNPESEAKSTSNSDGVEAPSTSHENAAPSGDKRAGSSTMKKLKTLFCFAAF